MFTKLIKQEKYSCGDLYNCCACGGENCGCAYCFDCHACDNCRSDDGSAVCELLQDQL